MPLRARSSNPYRRFSELTPRHRCSRPKHPRDKGISPVRKLLLLLTVIAAVCAVPAFASTKTTSLKDDFFVKSKLTVTKGTTVVWKWHTDDQHTVTEVHNRWGATTPKTKGTVKHKFKKRGKFTVYCVVHPTIMRQKIVVK